MPPVHAFSAFRLESGTVRPEEHALGTHDPPEKDRSAPQTLSPRGLYPASQVNAHAAPTKTWTPSSAERQSDAACSMLMSLTHASAVDSSVRNQKSSGANMQLQVECHTAVCGANAAVDRSRREREQQREL